MMKNKKNGFTLLELLFVMVVIAILVVISVPVYNSYAKKAKFQEVIQAAASYKSAVTACIVQKSGVTGCNAGSNGVPTPNTGGYNYVQSIGITDGAITATGDSTVFNTTTSGTATGATYILTPTYTAGDDAVKWTVSGTCLTAGLCDAPNSSSQTGGTPTGSGGVAYNINQTGTIGFCGGLSSPGFYFFDGNSGCSTSHPNLSACQIGAAAEPGGDATVESCMYLAGNLSNTQKQALAFCGRAAGGIAPKAGEWVYMGYSDGAPTCGGKTSSQSDCETKTASSYTGSCVQVPSQN